LKISNMQSEFINTLSDISKPYNCKLADGSKLLKSSFVKFKSFGLCETKFFPV
jgi:hypothetical protein